MMGMKYCPSCRHLYSLPKTVERTQTICGLCQIAAWCYGAPPSVETLWGPVPRPLDLHVLRAAKMFGVHRDRVTRQQRAVAKEAGFFMAYSRPVPSAIEVGIATHSVVEAWLKLFPGVAPQLPVFKKKRKRSRR